LPEKLHDRLLSELLAQAHQPSTAQERNEALQVAERVQLIRLREDYAKKLFCLMVFEVIAITGIVVSVGCGWMDFTQYKWLLHTFIVGTIGQILGMVHIITRKLFS